MLKKKETSREKTSVPQQERLAETDLAKLASELSDEDLKDVSGGLYLPGDVQRKGGAPGEAA